MWSPATNNTQVVAQHDAPIRHARFAADIGSGSSALVTGSWDKSVRYWDVRAPTGKAMGTVPMPERVYAMDLVGQLLAVGTADRKLLVFDVRNPATPYSQKESQLKYQTRCLACFPDQSGFAVGSVEGRVSIDVHVENKAAKVENFAFKCHRDSDGIHPINAIAFHPIGTFATVGADGGVNFWDKENRQRLKQFTKLNQPITDAVFSADGNIFAYAVGYDWSRGAENHNPSTSKSYILLKGVKAEDINRKPPNKPASGLTGRR
eukprot:CAMPEP_0198353738 /NCGR_PEP_ID=MMETSP1450-20131203/112576_1 /TAXON_ID=753684 ORGANISM="Madagascaria erythrocladiodes, Strain CCMP3234" /NCGR_SAMPLE_ID=MMETSP1450 /ASSEMBLY_ACC=CAM_ASM_001115 /LENGTH=262 /DNA_ID=CAMNT_0044059923 /DNA_START=39 /DNA_END=827 /DNA_ORIENTATION=+